MFYVFLIAVLNLGLGFAAAVQLGRRYNGMATVLAPLGSVASIGHSDDDADAKDDSAESTMDPGMKDSPEMPGTDILDGSDAIDEDSEDSTILPSNNESDEFESDLDKLFEDIDV